jgi:Flp pilus assembly protein TadD
MAYNNRGIAKIAKGDLDGAIADFRQAIKTDPNHPEAYTNLGLIWLQQGKTLEAEQNFTRSVALRPSVKTFIDTRTAQIGQH